MLFTEPTVHAYRLITATGAGLPQLTVGHRATPLVLDYMHLATGNQFGLFGLEIVTASAADTES